MRDSEENGDLGESDGEAEDEAEGLKGLPDSMLNEGLSLYFIVHQEDEH